MYNFTIRLQEKNGSRGHGYFFAIGKSKDLAAPMDCQGFPTNCVKDECQVQGCVKGECRVSKKKTPICVHLQLNLA